MPRARRSRAAREERANARTLEEIQREARKRQGAWGGSTIDNGSAFVTGKAGIQLDRLYARKREDSV